jgi:hypothetical protein
VAPSRTPVAVLRIPVVRDETEARGGIYAYLWPERKVAAPPATGNLRLPFQIAMRRAITRLVMPLTSSDG